MTVNIGQMRAEMAARRQELDWETRKFFVQFIAAIGAAFAGGAATLGLILHWTGRL